MAKIARRGGGGGRICDTWKNKSQALRSALKGKMADSEIRQILHDYLAVYASSISADHKTMEEALRIISGCRYTPLEATFTWLGRWRPSSAIILVVSTMRADNGKMMEALSDISGLSVPNLVLAEKQLVELNNLQEIISAAELEISNQHAHFQMLLADQKVVEALSSDAGSGADQNLSEGREAICSKLPCLKSLLLRADQLRLQTLKELYELLTPTQAALCTIVACDFLFALKSLGANLR